MKYVLIENAVVQYDDISNYLILDKVGLFEKKEYYVYSEYKPVFASIKAFLRKGKGSKHDLYVSTLFYFVPCFVQELQKYLGENVHVVPIYAKASNQKLMELYDNLSLVTTFNEGVYRCAISKSDAMKNVMDVMGKIGRCADGFCEGNENGLLCIMKINRFIDEAELEISLDSFNDYIVGDDSYNNIVKGDETCLTFSPYGSLRFYDMLSPRIHGFDFIDKDASNNVVCSNYNYVMLTLSGEISFKNSYQTWINTEKGGSFPIMCLQNGIENCRALMIPNTLVDESEIIVDDLRFGKFYVEMNSDYMGNLHINCESLMGDSFFQILQFAL